MEYEVIFDGTHQGQDRDLLCCPKIPQKRDAPPLTSVVVTVDRGGASGQMIVARLAISPCTARDLAAHTALSHAAVRSALERLTQHGVVEVIGKKRMNIYGASAYVYALTPDPPC